MTAFPGNPVSTLVRTIKDHGKRLKVAEQRVVNLETKLSKTQATIGTVTPAQMTAIATLTTGQIGALQTLSAGQINALQNLTTGQLNALQLSSAAQLTSLAALSTAQLNAMFTITAAQYALLGVTNLTFLSGLSKMGGSAWYPMTSNTNSADGAAAWQALNALLVQLQGNGYHA
jgi:hypothetical protein